MIDRGITGNIQHPGKNPRLCGVISAGAIPDLQKSILQNIFCQPGIFNDLVDYS
jgi:hypothetical protein